MKSVGDQCLGIENIASHSLSQCHDEVYIQADAGNSDTRVPLIGGGQIGIVVMVMVGMRMPHMQPVLSQRRHHGNQLMVASFFFRRGQDSRAYDGHR